MEVWLFGGSFVAGLLVGLELGFRRWRRNADEIQRVEWRGKIYKVEHADWQSFLHEMGQNRDTLKEP